jgi:UDP-GlcNAc3NAcA epimerase
MKILSIIGARPQFIKSAPVGEELFKRGIENIVINTGQHYDYQLSDIFFNDLHLPAPKYNLNIGANQPVQQISKILEDISPIIGEENPDCALVYGDTNSTLAAGLAFLKTGIPIMHIEGGERNFTKDRKKVKPYSIPEEANRVLIDNISETIFCASMQAMTNLQNEASTSQSHFVGDVMLDLFLKMSRISETKSNIISQLGLEKGNYVLATIHRAINTDNLVRLHGILHGLSRSKERVIFPIHPRTKKIIFENNLISDREKNSLLEIIEPVGYFDMLELEKNASLIVTDSGGVTREAYFAGIPNLIVDESTAWIELVESGWSHLVDAQNGEIEKAMANVFLPDNYKPLLGDGSASVKIAEILENWKK